MLAAGTFDQDVTNKIHILNVDFDRNRISLSKSLSVSFPASRLLFHPSPTHGRDIVAATVGSVLLLSPIGSEPATTLTMKPDMPPTPLTAFDWSTTAPSNIIIGAGMDGCCMVWDLDSGSTTPVHHIRPHPEAEALDVSISPHTTTSCVFTTAGGDGDVKLFDLRFLHQGHLLFESKRQILRASWNPNDEYCIGIVETDATRVKILDIRKPLVPVTELGKLGQHTAAINCITWAPQPTNRLCSVGDDGRAFIWGMPHLFRSEGRAEVDGRWDDLDPSLEYVHSSGPIHHASWSWTNPELVAITAGNRLEVLRYQ